MNLVYGEVDRVVNEENKVLLVNGMVLPYDALIIATGVSPRPDQTPGMVEGFETGSVHEFYTYDGSMALLEETRLNHLGKLAFRQIYWNVLIPGRPFPLPSAMSLAGKNIPKENGK